MKYRWFREVKMLMSGRKYIDHSEGCIKYVKTRARKEARQNSKRIIRIELAYI